MNVAAIVAMALLILLGLLQVALALGAPLGRAAWGGRHQGVIPTNLRIASGVAGFVVYPLIVLFVAASAGLIEAEWIPGTGEAGMWFLTGLFAVASLPNFVSPSKVERIWGPVALIVAACCGFIATRI